MSKNEKQVSIPTAILSIAVLAAGYLLLVAVLIYIFNLNNAVTKMTAKYFPYPAAIVGDKVITINQLESRLTASQKFYNSQDFSNLGFRVDFSTADGQKRLSVKKRAILNKMVEDDMIEQEANNEGIKLTSDMISQEVSKKAKQYSSQDDLKDNIFRLYGWTMSDFENNIVKADLYRQRLYENWRKGEKGFEEAKGKIEQAQKELASGKDFETVVGKYSEGDSAKNRGDLGWFDATQMLPEISDVAYRLEKNKTSDIIESSLGYHIIQVLDTKTEDNQDKVHIRQIFVRTPDFSDWLAEKEKNARIYIWLKDFAWNKETQEVEFNTSDMKNFEQKLQNDSTGDISVMF